MTERTEQRSIVEAALGRVVERRDLDPRELEAGSVRALLADELGADSTRCRVEVEVLAQALASGAARRLVDGDPGAQVADDFVVTEVAHADDARWAVATLSTALTPAPTVIVAASQDDPPSDLPTRRSGLRMLIAALVVGAIFALGAGAFTILQDTTRSRLALQTGQCFNGGTDDNRQVEIVSCEGLHDGVTIETYRLGQVNDPYPGRSEAQDEAEVCTTFETASNRQMAGYVPDQDAWESGRRNVICVERSSSGSPLPAE